jgi:hypothetical protein
MPASFSDATAVRRRRQRPFCQKIAPKITNSSNLTTPEMLFPPIVAIAATARPAGFVLADSALY